MFKRYLIIIEVFDLENVENNKMILILVQVR